MADPTPGDIRDLHRFLASEVFTEADPGVRDIMERERLIARTFGVQDIPRPPSELTDDQIEALYGAGFELRYLPVGRDRSPDEQGAVEDALSYGGEPGWYVVRSEPLAAGELSEEAPVFFDEQRIRLSFSPVRVVEFYQAVANLPESSFLDESVRMPTAPELYYLVRKSGMSLQDVEILCNHGPQMNEAFSLEVGTDAFYSQRYNVTEPFGGAVLPMQRVG